jgi:hypothetical protein
VQINRPLRGLFASMAILPLAACAGVYVNSPALTKTADAADVAVQASATLKPYDDQLANLATFETREDAAVAALQVARRDVALARLLSLAAPRRAPALKAAACLRLQQLLTLDCGSAPQLKGLANLSRRLSVEARLQADANALAAVWQ